MKCFVVIPCFVALLLLLPPGLAGAAEEHPSCRAPAEVREELIRLRYACLPKDPCWAKTLERLRGLVESHPDSVVVHRAYQDVARRDDLDALRAEYEARLAENPDDPARHYLYGRMFGFDETMREHIERSYALDPRFPWASYALMAIELMKREPEEPDEERAIELYRVFLAGCASNLRESLFHATRIRDQAFWREQLPILDRRVMSATPLEQADALPQLWELRFGLAQPEEYDEVRSYVAGQLATLEAHDLSEEERWWMTLKQGYEMTGDAERLAEVEAELHRLKPCSHDGTNATYEAFWRARGEKPSYDELEPAAARALLEATELWLDECPDALVYRFTRFEAVKSLADLDEATLLREMEAMLDFWERNQHRARMGRSPYFRVSDLLVERGVAVERVPELLAKEKEIWGDRLGREPSPSMPERMRQSMKLGWVLSEIELAGLLAEAHLQLDDRPASSEVLETMEELLLGLGELEDPTAERSGRGPWTRYWLLRAEYAHINDRPHAARAALGRAAVLSPEDEYAERLDELLEAMDLSLEEILPESDAAAAAPTDDVAAYRGWEESDEPVAEFELVDLEGRTWSEEDLRGRTTLINFWATWCGPCVAEMPFLEELHAALEGRSDLRLITLNVDRNPGLVEPFVARHELSIPVLFAAEAVNEWWQGYISIPRNWVVDTEGRVRRVQFGFRPEGQDDFVEEAITLMELVVSGADESSSSRKR